MSGITLSPDNADDPVSGITLSPDNADDPVSGITLSPDNADDPVSGITMMIQFSQAKTKLADLNKALLFSMNKEVRRQEGRW